LTRQASRVGLGVLGMLIIAQIPPHWFRIVAAPAYLMGLLLLALVLVLGDISEGAQRWLDIGPLTFQPSEIMKIAVPLIVAAWFHHRPIPPRPPDLLVIAGTVLIPVVLVALQPDMGTAILIAGAGGAVLYFAGLHWRMMGALLLLMAA